MKLLIFIVNADVFPFFRNLTVHLVHTRVWLLIFGACISTDKLILPAVTDKPHITVLKQTKTYFLLTERCESGPLRSSFLSSSGSGTQVPSSFTMISTAYPAGAEKREYRLSQSGFITRSGDKAHFHFRK